jgi:hypothetical protein
VIPFLLAYSEQSNEKAYASWKCRELYDHAWLIKGIFLHKNAKNGKTLA